MPELTIEEQIRNKSFWGCHPMCNNTQCIRWKSGCDASAWMGEKLKEWSDREEDEVEEV